MPEWFSERWEAIKEILGPRWPKIVGIVWACLGAYDLVANQILPEWIYLPPIRDVIGINLGWWWAWGWIGTALFAYAALEYVVRSRQPIDLDKGEMGLAQLFDYLMNSAEAFKVITDRDERHKKVDAVLGDALALGRLISYGRPAGDFIDNMFDVPSTMRIIETTFWANGAEIDWTSIDDTAPYHKRCSARSRDGATTYYDLTFDAAQVKRLWS